MLRECVAKARTNGYKPYKRLAISNGRCYAQGGKNPKNIPRPKTEEARLRQERSFWKHGRYSKETMARNRALRAMLSDSKYFLNLI